MNIKPGDICGFIYAQPGNDTTYVIVKGVDGDMAEVHDITFFDVAFKTRVSELWKASEEELDQGYQGTMYEAAWPRTTNRQLAAKARARFGFPVDRGAES